MTIQKLLCEEIKEELETLKELPIGSDERKATVDTIAKLTDRAIELEKIDSDEKIKKKDRESDLEIKFKQLEEQIESRKADVDIKLKQLDEQIESRKTDADLRQKQLDEEQKSRFISNCIGVASIVIPSIITIWGTLKSFEFEKEGTVTTIMGRGFVNKLLSKK